MSIIASTKIVDFTFSNANFTDHRIFDPHLPPPPLKKNRNRNFFVITPFLFERHENHVLVEIGMDSRFFKF